jgi:hypothetical protein
MEALGTSNTGDKWHILHRDYPKPYRSYCGASTISGDRAEDDLENNAVNLCQRCWKLYHHKKKEESK